MSSPPLLQGDTQFYSHDANEIDFGFPSWIKSTTINRGFKRLKLGDVEKLSPTRFRVIGRSDLSDNFEDYEVTSHDGPPYWSCSCARHHGGQYRKICSHILACRILSLGDSAPRFVSESDLIVVEKPIFVPEPTLEKPAFVDLPPAPRPAFVVAEEEELFVSRDEIQYPEIATIGPDLPLEEYSLADAPTPDLLVDLGGDWDWEAMLEGGPGILGETSIAAEEMALVEYSAPVASFEDEYPHEELAGWTKEPAPSSQVQATPHPIPAPTIAPISSIALPTWCTGLRANQVSALEQIATAILSGKRNILLDAPVGMGKTLTAWVLGQMLHAKTNYVATTKSLQRQALKDLPRSKLLEGRSNYPSADFGHSVTCENCDFNKERGCTYCIPTTDEEGEPKPYTSKQKCPYQRAKRAAQQSETAILNTAYALTAFNFFAAGVSNSEKYWPFQPLKPATEGFQFRGLTIYDEADELEKSLMGFVECSLGRKILDHFNTTAPEKTSRWKKRIEWLESLLSKIDTYLKDEFEKNPGNEEKFLKTCVQTRAKIKTLLEDLRDFDDADERREAWVYEPAEDLSSCVFKPVRVHKYGRDLLFNHSHVNLIMSGTIVAPEQFSADLGLGGTDTTYIPVPSTFHEDRRPVFVRSIAPMTYKEKANSQPKIAEEILRIRKEYPGRMLVHTVSYELNTFLKNYLSDRDLSPITYHQASEREDALARYRKRENGILLAPSMERGIDLKHDECRICVIPKVPFPSLGDPQIARRIWQPTKAEGEVWYRCQTLRTIIQMTARGMRAEDDWCRIFILDSQFVKLFREMKHFLPKWWVDSVRMDSRDPILTLEKAGKL